MNNSGLGREYVRRAVLFASQHGYEKIWTSIFVRHATSFWLGLGFRAERYPVEPDWKHGEDRPKETKIWQERTKNNPDALWDLARTELGKRVLDVADCGVLQLSDSKQRQYAFARLQLP